MKLKKEENQGDDMEHFIDLSSVMKWVFTVKHYLLRLNISFLQLYWKSIIISLEYYNEIKLQNNQAIQTYLEFTVYRSEHHIEDINTRILNSFSLWRWFSRIELNEVYWFHYSFSKNRKEYVTF